MGSEGAIDSEPIRARGKLLISKIKLVGQKYREQNNFSYLKAGLKSFFVAKKPALFATSGL